MKFAVLSDGGCTMNWRGMVIRCGEQEAHTTLPHFLSPQLVVDIIISSDEAEALQTATSYAQRY